MLFLSRYLSLIINKIFSKNILIYFYFCFLKINFIILFFLEHYFKKKSFLQFCLLYFYIFSQSNWEEALFTVSSQLRRLKGSEIAGLSGALNDAGKNIDN